jgi:hypothetical protein
MAETVVYIRAPFSFPPEFGIPDDLIRDARILLNLDAAQVEAVRGQLGAFGGFLDRATIQQVLSGVVEDEQTCEALATFITNVDRRLRDFHQNVDQLLSQIEEWTAKEENRRKGLLSPEEFQQLKERMPLLIRRFAGLSRQAKAQRLSQATGLPLETIDIICDLRPVFDKDRDRVEGMIPYTTLRIVCKGVDGLPMAMDALLSRRDVQQLAKAAANAEKKLARLHELLREKQVPIPHVTMTMEAEQE